MKLTTEIIKLDHVVGKDRTQVMVETDVIVPDTKPDVVKVLQVDANSRIKSYEVLQDKVSADLVVKFEILYIGEDKVEPMYAIFAREELNQMLGIPGTKSEMYAKCKCKIEHAECKVLNPRKLNVKAIVEIEAEVEKDEKLEVVTNCDEDDKVQLKKQKIKLNTSNGKIEVPIILKHKLDIPVGKPFAKNLIKANAGVLDKHIRFSTDKAECKGTVRVNIVYVSDPPDALIEFIENELAFSEIIDIPGAQADMDAIVDIEVEEIESRIKEDDDGDNSIIELEIVLRVKIEANQTVEKDVVVDAYSVNSKLNIEKKAVNLSDFIGENQVQSGVKDILAIPENLPQIDRIFSVEAQPVVTDSEVIDGRVIIEGVLGVKVLYLSNDEGRPIQSIYKEIPVKQMIEVQNAKKDMKVNCSLDVEHTSYTLLSDKEVEFRIVVTAYAMVYNYYKKQLIVNMNPSDEKVEEGNDVASIVVYVVQDGDTLWDIAKRYYTTVEQLASVNNIENPELIKAGQKIYIFKSVKV